MRIKKIWIAAIVIVLIAGGTVMWLGLRGRSSEQDASDYIYTSTSLDLKDLADTSRKTKEKHDGYFYTSCEVRLKINETDAAFTNLKERMKTVFGEPMENNDFIPTIPEKEPDHSIINALREKQILFSYIMFQSGKKVKTEEIYAYLAKDTTGQIYYYQFD